MNGPDSIGYSRGSQPISHEELIAIQKAKQEKAAKEIEEFPLIVRMRLYSDGSNRIVAGFREFEVDSGIQTAIAHKFNMLLTHLTNRSVVEKEPFFLRSSAFIHQYHVDKVMIGEHSFFFRIKDVDDLLGEKKYFFEEGILCQSPWRSKGDFIPTLQEAYIIYKQSNP